MTLRHMKIFVSVFRNNSITKAAYELHLAQPSVSFCIKEMENYYGIRLFERIGRGISPTECGKEFYSYAVHITALFDEMEKKIRNWDSIGTIRVGASITIGTHIFPGLIRQYQNLCPDLRIETVINKSSDIESAIVNNEVDIGLIENSPESSEVEAEPFMKDMLCAIVSSSHRLAERSRITLEELAEFPFLMREKGSAGREILDALFALMQKTVKPLWESSSTQAIVQAAAIGIGVAVLPYLLVERDIREQKVKMLSLEPPVSRDLNIIWHKSKFLTPNMKLFISMCREYGKEISRPASTPNRENQEPSL